MISQFPPLPSAAVAPPTLPAGSRLQRWRQAWNGSLRFRLLVLGLLPLLVAFPLVIGVLVWVGGERAESLLSSNVRSSLSAARNYLDQMRTQSGARVSQLARSERLVQLVDTGAPRRELDSYLRTAAEGAGLDFLVAAAADGEVIGSSTGVALGQRIPDSWVIRQARIGVANTAYERFDAAQLAAFSPAFPEQARVALQGGGLEARALLITAGAHFPLSVRMNDVILVGGILLNRNFPLIEHLREVLFPVGSLPDEAEGMASLHLEGTSIATSRQRLQGQRAVGEAAAAPAVDQVIGRGQDWVGLLEVGGTPYMAGYEALVDGEGQRVGMIGTGFPEAPYTRMTWLLLGLIALLLAATMLVLSLLFLRAGRELTQRLDRIARTMSLVRQGDRSARLGRPLRDDELGRLSQHFDVLLETIEAQDARQRQAQQAIVDEASRRRALFEAERDGVVILEADGRVFEANPKAAQMLGCDVAQLLARRVSDWDAALDAARLDELLAAPESGGRLYETEHRRADGSRYAAEVALSVATWGERRFVVLLQRDISERKAVEAELAQYRSELERLVELRTLELHERSEQLDAIFALSPDGFVSFDAQRQVRFANRAFLRLTGLDPATLLGMDEAAFSARLQAACREAAPFPPVAQLRAERQRLADRGSSSFLPEEGAPAPVPEPRRSFELLRPRPRVVEVGLRLAQADNVSQVLYFRDITHETEVDRMKSEFLSTAAHELRTPMTSIYGFVKLLRMREFTPDRRNDLLSTIAQQSELMITIINQLLDLARIEARRGQDFRFEPVALQDVVAAVLAGYAPPAGREPPRLADCPQPLQVRGDHQKLQQALLNIVANAYKYSPAGGPVEIHYRLGEHHGQDCWGVAVRDHGIGMTEEQRSHVCERFYRADASGNIPGTGLGMSIVKEIVDLHQGEVEIASTPGEGSEVTLWFPALS